MGLMYSAHPKNTMHKQYSQQTGPSRQLVETMEDKYCKPVVS